MRIPALLALAFSACGGGPAVQPEQPAWLAPLQQACGDELPLRGGPLPADANAIAGAHGLAGPGAVLLVDGSRVPPLQLAPPQLQALRDFVQRGGRLLLLGYAAALASELGVEARPPDVVRPFRWGFDSSTAMGRAELGFLLVSGRMPELTSGLRAAADGEHVYRFAGGAGVQLPQCLWSAVAPQNGEVLGRLSVLRDGRVEVDPAAVLVRWHAGRGAVLACGLMPEVDNADATLAGNARALLANAVRWLGNGSGAPVPVWRLEPAPGLGPPAPLPPLGQRELPAAPLLAHWGVEVAVGDVADVLPPAAVVDDVLLPTWRAGADLSSLDLGDRERRLPLPWPADDPLRRPPGWRGDAFWPDWGPAAVAALAREAHARGMLLQLALPDLPLQPGPVAGQLAGLRFLARQLGDRRRLGDGAIDGVALQRWFDDRSGLAVAMLQDYQPLGFVQRLGAAVLGGGVRAVDADDGRPLGLLGSGLSAQWRDGFPADEFATGRLDCRQRPGGRDGLGGGSAADWLLTQCNDFVRRRLGRGASLWWRGLDASATPQLAAYLAGISQEPLRAAVATSCFATGVGGWRDAERQLHDGLQPGFGAELAVPAATHLLQNNHFRLHGSGGSWQWDPQALARFRAGEALRLSPELIATRLYGGRPDAGEVQSVLVDLFAGGRREAGGFAEAVRTGTGQGSLPPAALASGAAPEWPQLLRWDLQLPAGYYELDLQLQTDGDGALLVLGVDGDDRQCIAVRAGAPLRQRLPLHCARGGDRTLSLECVRGAAVRLQRVAVQRAGDLAAEARVLQPAGALASLQEQTSSSYFAETTLLTAIADWPGLCWRAECTRAVRNLQLERRFALPHHRRLRRCGAGEDQKRLRAPFVLQSDDAAIPDLAVVPLRLSRYAHFTLGDDGLVLHGAPVPGSVTEVGLLLLLNGEAAALERLPQLFEQLARPQPLDLAGGSASLQGDLPFPCTRVLHLQQASRTPYLVRERGYWTWRGATAAAAGGDLLRVVQLPGDTVQIVGGPALLQRTRPGPGSLGCVALRDPTDAAVTACVLQASPLQPPAVTMAAEFDEVFVDGQPWSYFDGRTVLLPWRPGRFAVETRRHGGELPPHLLATQAPIDDCRWDPARRQLSFLAGSAPQRPPELPYVALLAGPEPVAIDGGERLPEGELRLADAAAGSAGRGVLIRFRPGRVVVSYGD